MKSNKVLLKSASCALDMGDGSERSFYVNQDYILSKMKKVHRGISLMYTYYPMDDIWPQRASIALPDNKAGGAWNFPYEDYFPYLGGINGNREAEPFNYMKEIRRRGQDVVLTLTIDPTLEDKYLIGIARDLRPYGRMYLRINHECTGTWFCFNRRADYQTIADFFVRFAKILKEYAPNVKTILCAGMFMKEEGKVEMEDIFLEAHKVCDIWSGDHYLSLHWGWPVTVCEKGSGNDFACYDVDEVYDQAKATLHRLREITGMDKPFILSELNGDGDVTGAFVQSNMMRHFMNRLEKDPEHWLTLLSISSVMTAVLDLKLQIQTTAMWALNSQCSPCTVISFINLSTASLSLQREKLNFLANSAGEVQKTAKDFPWTFTLKSSLFLQKFILMVIFWTRTLCWNLGATGSTRLLEQNAWT